VGREDFERDPERGLVRIDREQVKEKHRESRHSVLRRVTKMGSGNRVTRFSFKREGGQKGENEIKGREVKEVGI